MRTHCALTDAMDQQGWGMGEKLAGLPPRLHQLIKDRLITLKQRQQELGPAPRAFRVGRRARPIVHLDDLLDHFGVTDQERQDSGIRDLTRSMARARLTRTNTPTRATPGRNATPTRTPLARLGQNLFTGTPTNHNQPRTPVSAGRAAQQKTDLERADRLKQEQLQERSERIRLDNEKKQEAAKARKQQIEDERLAKLRAKGTPMMGRAKELQSPRVPLKKALFTEESDDEPIHHVTHATSAKRSSPRRKPARTEYLDTSSDDEDEPQRRRGPIQQTPADKKKPVIEVVMQEAESEEDHPMEQDEDEHEVEQFDLDKQVKLEEQPSFASPPEEQMVAEDEGVEEDEEELRAQENKAMELETPPPRRPSTMKKALSMHTQDNKKEATPDEPKEEKKRLTEDNYDIDDLNSGDETDDEDKPRKKIPAWATGNALRNCVRSQSMLAFDYKTYFGPTQEVDLSKIFGVKEFKPRSSSAVWESPINRPRPGFSTLDASQVVEMDEYED
ncbi:unnamed protein product, partial [Mesorhabditis spiculigera]